MTDPVQVPYDRTIKQPVRCFCLNPECIDAGNDRYEFTIQHADVVCPKCGANQVPVVGVLAIVHFIMRDRHGALMGHGGLRYRLACEPRRTFIATHTNLEAGSGELSAVSCVRCLAIAKEQNAAASQGTVIQAGQGE